MTVFQEGAAAAMPQDDSAGQFKLDLRDAARAAHFESLRDIEDKTGLSHATVSAAFSPAQPLPSERTVHAVAKVIEVDARPWIDRLRSLTSKSVDASPHGQDAADAEGSPQDPSPAGGGQPEAGLRTRVGAVTADAVARPVRPPTAGPGSPDPGAAPPPPDGDPGGGVGWPRPRLRWAVGAAVAVVLFGAGFASGYMTRGPDRSASSAVAATVTPGKSTRSAGSVAPGASSSAVTSGGSGESFQETVIPENAAPTFKDPLTVRGLGPKIPANTTVTVTCRLFSDAVPSAYPDGYWYRIESSPWNGDYYAAANAFLNGDPPGDPTQYKHATDMAVPKC